MSDLLMWKKNLQELYAKRSNVIDRGLKFVLGLLAFLLINKNIGVFKLVMSPAVSAGLALVCAFLPPVVIVLVAAMLITLHLYFISLGVMAVSVLVFIVMFLCYCRFTPQKAVLLLITPLAFWLKIPYAVPVACGLAFAPVSAVPVSFGTIVYFMLEYVKQSEAALSSAEGMMGQISLFVKSVFADKAMWITIFAFIACIIIVYVIRRKAIDHAWKIAIASGVVVNVLIIGSGYTFVNHKISFVTLILGNLVAIAVGMLLELFLFSVDYSRSENLQFEDDEYYYYVKAVPKISITSPEKTIKTINERRNTTEAPRESHRTPTQKTQMRKTGTKKAVKKKVKRVKPIEE